MRARGDPGARQGVSRVKILGSDRRAVLAAAGILLAPWLGARADEVKSGATQVASGRKVSIEYTLVLDDGTKADSNIGGEPLVYEQGANQILPALETALAGLSVNDTKKITLSPKDGYGDIDPKAVKEVPIEEIPEAARKVDAVLIGVDAEGNQRPVRVQKVGEKVATLDLNHPLAGRTLTFDVKVLKIE
jgi:FKBP-type peptidyl-prolyl cis-trans isomerase 2